MKPGEKGFTLIELLIAATITALVALSATAAVFQIFRVNDRNNDHLAAVRQVENAGFWISRDAQRADNVTIDNLTPPDFLIITWKEWSAEPEGDPVSTNHSARYFFQDLTTDGIGKLKRNHTSVSDDETTLVATGIYYYPDDSDNTSQASYQSPVLTVRLTALSEETLETREYKIKRRPSS